MLASEHSTVDEEVGFGPGGLGDRGGVAVKDLRGTPALGGDLAQQLPRLVAVILEGSKPVGVLTECGERRRGCAAITAGPGVRAAGSDRS